MTKSMVRAIVVSWLNIGKKSICWDIGCGTGSVSVEMALKCPDGKVFSFDKNSQAVELTLKNAEKFGCDNIKVYEGTFPQYDGEKLSPPDSVFIGGSAGKMAEIVSHILKLNPFAKIVITAVSLETLSECVGLFEAEITQVAVTKTRKTGSYTMFSAENPIFIIRRKF